MIMKKFLCWLLAVLMFLSLVACGVTPEDPTGSSEGLASTEGTETETEDPNYTCDLPTDLNYGGETVGKFP